MSDESILESAKMAIESIGHIHRGLAVPAYALSGENVLLPAIQGSFTLSGQISSQEKAKRARLARDCKSCGAPRRSVQENCEYCGRLWLYL